jgi:hypothetical protein
MWLYLLLLLLAALVVAFLYYSALLTPIKLLRLPSQRLHIAYVTYIGPYKEAYKRNSEIEAQLAKVRSIPWEKEPCFGIYYDNPQVTKASECRALVGKIIPDDLEEKELDGVKFGYIDEIRDSLQIRYPLRSILCIFAGIYRVYPEINKFWEREGTEKARTAMVELYGFHGQTITFLQGIGEAEGLLGKWPGE